MKESGAFPSTGKLIGEAFDHWANHQRRFWIIAGPAILVLAALPYAESHLSTLLLIRYGLDLRSSLVAGGIRVLLTALILYQWFKYALYDDWNQRRHRLWERERLPWHAFVSGGFVAFWMLQLLLTRIIGAIWGGLIQSQMSSPDGIIGGKPFPWFAHLPMPWINAIVLAVLFGGFLLFLPARAAGIPWGPWHAFREATGVRTRLIGIALFLAFLLAVGDKALDVLEIFVLPQHGRWLSTDVVFLSLYIRGLLMCFIELLTLYVLAYAVSQLFIMKTGWTRETEAQFPERLSRKGPSLRSG